MKQATALITQGYFSFSLDFISSPFRKLDDNDMVLL